MNSTTTHAKAARLLRSWSLSSLMILAASLEGAIAGAPLKIAVTPGPAAEIAEVIAKAAKPQGIDLKVIEFSDWVRPNIAVDSGEADVNLFEHIPFLKAAIKAHGLHLTAAAPLVIMPVGLYSHKIKSFADVQDGATIAIANDPVNGARGLRLLQKAGLITLKPNVGDDATVHDIIENPKHLKIIELDAAQLVRSLDDTTIAQASMSYLIAAGEDPKTALLTDGEGDPHYAIQLVVHSGRESDPSILKLIEIAHSPEIKSFITKRFEGVIVPAW
ncbi:MetQ/NlpA family ABC transporter substrate-binding protein [Beijerinckia indica]|uniref:Lipoprotein n=1 Tax=Beijerinckia indica subsp. indica (strain ATCC 9039 / DSM 1715 / NCIMB 8712) TaxID=395963 RepID=B2IIB0_BEII9|nr:MetQ/NlpA family ABC transporter substrate-binding protein [Beijerinckia indica]ACB96064.1 NLPA lipoprotein [Beijerinckia indica subsp. indica ATCC 9039]